MSGRPDSSHNAAAVLADVFASRSSRREYKPPTSDELKSRFGIDVDEFDAAPYVPPPQSLFERLLSKIGRTPEEIPRAYRRLAVAQRRQLQRRLQNDNGLGGEWLYDSFREWKRSSSPRPATQNYERAIKETFDIDTYIRETPESPDRSTPPSPQIRNALTEFFAATQGFLVQHYGETIRVHRGVRKQKAARLFQQVLENPSRDAYYVKTSVVSNHSTLPRVGSDYSDGIVIRWKVHAANILTAVDHLQPEDEPSEAEVHVHGGILELPPDAIRHTGLESHTEEPAYVTVQRMESPEKLELVEHRDIADLLELMSEYEIPVQTAEGKDRVTTWFSYAKNSGAFSDDQLKTLQEQIRVVTESSA